MDQKLRILHLEDNPKDAELIRALLEADGLDLDINRVETEDGFVSSLKMRGFDIIISDFSLPSYRGSTALTAAKEVVPEIPFIFVSGTIGEEAAITSLLNGATDYVLKTRIERLVPAVRRAMREIEERKSRQQAEELLRQSESSFRHLFFGNPHPMWVYQRESLRFLEVNDAAIDSYGYSRAQFLNMSITEIRPAEDIPLLMSTIKKGRDAFEQPRLFRHRASDGRIFMVDVSSHTLSFGGQDAVLVVAQDVTEKHAAEKALRLFRTLIDQSNDAFEIVDPDSGRFLDVNEKACRDLGYNRTELLDLKIVDVTPALDPESYGKMCLGLKAMGFVVIEAERRRKDGSIYPVEMSMRSVELDRAYIVLVARDITERNRAEATLRETQERFRLISENVEDLIAVLDLQGRRVYNSPSYARVLGKHGAQSGSDSFTEIHPDDRERIRAVFEESVRTGLGKRAEYRLITKEGRIHYVESQGSAIRDKSGQIVNVVVVSRDVTEKRLLEQQFLRAQRLESLGTLASGIAHDLNNVLAPIILAINLLRRSIADEKGINMLRTLEVSAERGRDIVKQILTFGRGMAGEKGHLQLKHIVKDTLDIIQQTLPKSITIRDQVPKDLWAINGDATQLHQLLTNLCVNARDAMPEGGSLTLLAENVSLAEADVAMHPDGRPGRFVRVSVEDSGTGIPPEVRARIFEPFFTTKGPGKGTGLGLPTVQSIVKSHEGFLEVESELGKGTKFSAYFPIAETLPEAVSKEAESVPLTASGELILVIDDEASIREIARQALEAYGYEVLTASSGNEAVLLYREKRDAIALVLTDMMMPDLDGVKTIEALRKINPAVKVIASTGSLSHNGVDPTIKVQAEAVLIKPYSSETLLRKIHDVLHAGG